MANGKMIPASTGSVLTSEEAKKAPLPEPKKGEGPDIGEKGEYKRASYKTRRGAIREDR